MKYSYTIKINFLGGIMSPGDLYNILVAAGNAGIAHARFGLRQQLLMEVVNEEYIQLTNELDSLGIDYEVDKDDFPNIVSSYPAEEIFITKTWLSEGVYKDIFDEMGEHPKLKINISDSNQSFTPMLTGNINWIAAPGSPHFWHLFIRFPKTNVIYEWKKLLYTNDIARMSKHIETLIFEHPEDFIDNPLANGDKLFEWVEPALYITKIADQPLKLSSFNLPYYEGLNRYNDKYWLGIYRRDELFKIDFLKEICVICLKTKIGQLCSTPWKTIIVKSIEEKDRTEWNDLLARHRINVRHAANELNFQVEDNCKEGLELKHYLLQRLHHDDTRTFGICIGIKTRKKTEVFSSILIRRRSILTIAGIELLHVYDILCAKDFNPNERTGFVFSSGNPKFLLAEQLRRAIFSFYKKLSHDHDHIKVVKTPSQKPGKPTQIEYVHQCKECLTVYEDKTGEPSNRIPAGTAFRDLPQDYCCSLCENPKNDFVKVEKSSLGLQSV
jgi:rubredoxin